MVIVAITMKGDERMHFLYLKLIFQRRTNDLTIENVLIWTGLILTRFNLSRPSGFVRNQVYLSSYYVVCHTWYFYSYSASFRSFLRERRRCRIFPFYVQLMIILWFLYLYIKLYLNYKMISCGYVWYFLWNFLKFRIKLVAAFCNFVFFFAQCAFFVDLHIVLDKIIITISLLSS